MKNRLFIFPLHKTIDNIPIRTTFIEKNDDQFECDEKKIRFKLETVVRSCKKEDRLSKLLTIMKSSKKCINAGRFS